jgi:hypothetical protein
MERKDSIFERYQESVNKLDGRFYVLEQKVPVKLQMEYFKYSEHLRKSGLKIDDDAIESYKKDIYNQELPAEQKRHALATLATSNHVKSFRILEKYAQKPDPEVTNWAYMALMESRISLESELLEEKQIYISTGLGGKGNKLRFYILVLAAENKPFEEYQRRVIEREFDYYLSREECEIEYLTIHDVYVELLFLVPVRKDIKMTLENIVGECNQYGNFLSPSFRLSNVKEFTPDEIAAIVRKEFGKS